MARPTKTGLDYFPLDVDFDDDDKVALIEAKFGAEGYRVIVKLFCRIYGTHGYWCEWGDKERVLFAARKCGGLSTNQLDEIVSYAIEVGLFDVEIFNARGSLTSKGIQRRYLEATKKRGATVGLPGLWLLDSPKQETSQGNGVSGEKTGVIDAETPVSGAETTQSKVKESKENESKGKKKKERIVSLEDLTPEHLDAFRLAFPGIDVQMELIAAKNWTRNKGRIHKDAAAFFENWLISEAKRRSERGGMFR